MTTSTQIRAAIPDDADELKKIGEIGWETTYAAFIEPANRQRYLAGPFWSVERLRHVIQDDACDSLVAMADGKIAGFLTAEPHHDDVAELTRFYVNPEHRGIGIGRKLWQTALASLRARGNSAILVNVFGDNSNGRRFYERLGFQLSEETTTKVGTQTVYDVWYRLAL